MYDHRRIHRISAFLATILVALPVVAGGLKSQAPPETEQFAFMIGEWSCKTRFMKPDGSGFIEAVRADK